MVMLDFMKIMFVNGKPLAAWITLLLAANLIVPLIFIRAPEAQVVLAALMAGAITQVALFKRMGFVRLLGVGHIYWVPLIPWLWARLQAASLGGFFQFWLLVVIVLDGVALVIDATDVIRYNRGDRAPHVSLAGRRREKLP